MYEFERMGTRLVYKDQCFDSLTEARWAVYFDRIGIPYEYEPESFELHTDAFDAGTMHFPARKDIYTPDFFLPEQDSYVEVKRGNADDGTAFKLGKLAVGSGKTGILIDGRPGHFAMFLFSPDLYSPPYYESKMNGFTCNYFYSHHMLLPPEDKDPELRNEMTALTNEIFNMKFYIPTDEQLSAKLTRRKENRNNPIVIASQQID